MWPLFLSGWYCSANRLYSARIWSCCKRGAGREKKRRKDNTRDQITLRWWFYLAYIAWRKAVQNSIVLVFIQVLIQYFLHVVCIHPQCNQKWKKVGRNKEISIPRTHGLGFINENRLLHKHANKNQKASRCSYSAPLSLPQNFIMGIISYIAVTALGAIVVGAGVQEA